MPRNGSTHRYIAYRRRRRNGRRGLSRWLTALIVLGVLSLLAVGVGAGAGYGAYQSCISGLVEPDVALAQLPRGGARIYDSNNKLLFEYLNEDIGIRREVPVEEVSFYLIAATIASEDASFKDNPGINVKGLARAAWDNLSPFGDTPGFLEGRGGSSITQQLVKNVYYPPEERGKRTVARKWKEVCFSLELTRQHEKSQIMEWYLNLISYGNNYTGVEAASQGYFEKSARDLTLAEAALLAGIPASPTLYEPIANPETARANQIQVLQRMEAEKMITAADVWEAAAEPIEVQQQEFDVEAPHFVFNVIEPQLDRLFGEEAKWRDGLKVYTTLDLELQDMAEEVVDGRISGFEATGGALGHNGALVAMDPETARILAYVGSRDYFNQDIDGKNNMAGSLNSPGSAFKPFTYLTAFTELGWGPGTWILDTNIAVPQEGGAPFIPCNPSGCGSYMGQITIREALGNSLNIPAVKTMMYAGVPEVIAQAKKMGITTIDSPYLGPALTVGGGDVKLADMVYAFTVFPELGMLKGAPTEATLPPGNRTLDPISILRVEDADGKVRFPLVDGEPVDEPVVHEERVAPEAETYLVNDILIDPNAECLIFGCDRLSLPDGRPLAVKTGTSAPYPNSRQTGDTWSIAYTPQIVAGAWFGNTDNSPIGFVSSTTVAWPIIQEFMTEYHRDLPVEQFTKPDDVVEGSVCLLSGFRPTKECPLTTPDDLFAEDSLPEGAAIEDSEDVEDGEDVGEVQEGEEAAGQEGAEEEEDDDPWWEVATIDVRTGLLASALTTPEYAGRRLFLRLPEGLSSFEVDQATEWAAIVGATIGEPPDKETTLEDIPIPIAITSPANGARVQSPVTITGRAQSFDFVEYILEYKAGSRTSPGEWTRITRSRNPVADGILGRWTPRKNLSGIYTIRLTVVDRERGESMAFVSVVLEEAKQPPPPQPTPIATPEPAITPTPTPRGGRGPRR